MIKKYIAVTLLVTLLAGLTISSRAAAFPEGEVWAEVSIPAGLDLVASTGVDGRAATNPKLDEALGELAATHAGQTIKQRFDGATEAQDQPAAFHYIGDVVAEWLGREQQHEQVKPEQ